VPTYVESVDYNIPREAAGLILDLVMSRICSDLVAQMDVSLGLFQNDATIAAGTALADLTPADFTGYAAIVLNDTGDCAGFVQGPATGGDGEWRLIQDQQEFTQTAATISNDIYGAYIWDTVGGRLLGAVRFDDAPLPMAEADSVIKVTGELILFPQIAGV